MRAVAAPAARIVSSKPSSWNPRDRDRRHREGRQRDHHELARAGGRAVAGSSSAGGASTVSAVSAATSRPCVATRMASAGEPDAGERGRALGRRAATAAAESGRSARRRLQWPSAPRGRRCRPGTRRCNDRSRRSRTSRTGPTTSRTCGSATGGSGPGPCGRKFASPATRPKPRLKQLSQLRSADRLLAVEVGGDCRRWCRSRSGRRACSSRRPGSVRRSRPSADDRARRGGVRAAPRPATGSPIAARTAAT